METIGSPTPGDHEAPALTLITPTESGWLHGLTCKVCEALGNGRDVPAPWIQVRSWSSRPLCSDHQTKAMESAGGRESIWIEVSQ